MTDIVQSFFEDLANMSTGYTISGSQHPDVEYISTRQALHCLALVERWFAEHAPGADPKLYRDHEGTYWNISYEGYDGWPDWPAAVGEAFRQQFADAGVFVEPGAAWCLNLHPAS